MIKKIGIFLAVFVITIFVALIATNNINKATFKNDIGLNDYSIETTVEETTETTTEEIKSAKLTFTGDLMVHQWQMDNAYNKESDSYDFNYTFEPVYKYLKDSDLTVGNLETVFAGKEVGYSDYPCFNTPDSFLEAIKNAGFDVLTTANNHSMDKGVNGAIRTIELLDEAEIGHFGTYKSQEDSERIFTKEVNGIKLAFVSSTYGVNGNYIPKDKEYIVNILSEEKIKADIEKAKEENPDLLIVMPHIGNEYESYPKDVFKNWIDIMIKAGADVVIASHPHVLQPMEMRSVELENGELKTAFVAYSMANFISSQRTEPRDTGVILKLEISKRGNEGVSLDKISYIPTWVQWRNTSNEYMIRVLSIFDALKERTENKYALRAKDYIRLEKAQLEATETISGESVALENIAEEYILFNNEKIEGKENEKD